MSTAGGRVAGDSATVYSTDSRSYTNSLGTSFTDLDLAVGVVDPDGKGSPSVGVDRKFQSRNLTI